MWCGTPGPTTIGRMRGLPHRHEYLPAGFKERDHRTSAGSRMNFFLWPDPANSNRVLVYMTNWTSGLPDPDHPG